MTTSLTLSFVLPVHNEEESLPAMYEALVKTIGQLGESAEMIFVDDGSTDRSYDVLVGLHERDPRVKVVQLSRNFDHQTALTAGLDYASGQAIVTMDADLQHPPEVAIEMLKRWRAGAAVVYTERLERRGDSPLRRLIAKWYYRLLERMTEITVPMDAGDFRLMDRRVVQSLRHMRERNRYLRGMVSWIGFPYESVSFVQQKRRAGRSKYSLVRLLKFAKDGIMSFSVVPLRLILNIGFVLSAVSFLAGMAAIVVKLLHVYIIPGWTSVIVGISFLGGIQLVVLGIIGEYVGRIYEEVKQRPLYIVRRLHGLSSPEARSTPPPTPHG